MTLPRKVFCIFGALLFLVFAGLQINDASQYNNTDAWVWIMLYGVMSGLNVLLLFRQIHEKWLYAWCAFTCGALLFRLQDAQGNLHLDWLHPANYWDSNNTMVQHSNESGGLLVLVLWAFCTIWAGKKTTKD